MSCCSNENNLLPHDCGMVCVECGTIKKEVVEAIEYKVGGVSFINKTYIPYNPRFKHIIRLQQWANYSYREVKDNELMILIDNLNIKDREVKNLTKILFLDQNKKIKVRANIRDGLISYCIYKAHLIYNKPIEIDDILDMMKITEKHYNSAIKKIKYDKLLLPKNINLYLKLIKYKIKKNYLIRVYNNFSSKSKKYNSKTKILGIIYYLLSQDPEFNPKDFYRVFKISKHSIGNIITFIEDNTEQIID